MNRPSGDRFSTTKEPLHKRGCDSEWSLRH